ncbi:MAG TPA: MauE/DoxX family redox-associated membrane protein [Chitinophagaceae bacterium]|nr:MauE/DoxX family redox-associated membrane protein [Chitinophagaceae bacterium]
MKPQFSNNILLPAARLVLAVTFFYAALAKGTDFSQFTLQMKQSPLLETFNTNYIGIGVLAVEIITGCLLSIHHTFRLGLYASFFIMLLFSAYLAVLHFGYSNAPCACGGILGSLSYPAHIAFNITLTLLALAGILLSSPSQLFPFHPQRRRQSA